MTYITTGERIGYKRGELAKGRSMILRMLNKQLGEVSKQNLVKIESLTVEQLDALCEALLDFTSTDDLVRWLNQHS